MFESDEIEKYKGRKTLTLQENSCIVHIWRSGRVAVTGVYYACRPKGRKDG
jgi:hypothetical protein